MSAEAVSRRTLLAGTAALGALALTAGCGEDRVDAGGELRWASGSISADGPAQAVARLWNSRRLGPPVRVTPIPESADDQHQLLAAELGGGLGDLDVVELDVVWLAEFASNGWLTELDDVADDVTAVATPAAAGTCRWHDTWWAAPFTSDLGLLYRRSDLIPTAPRDWGELRTAATGAGRRRGVAPYVADGAPAEGLVVQFLEYFWAAGGQVVDGEGVVTFATEPARRALEFLQAGTQDGFYAPGFDAMGLEQARETFRTGSALAMRSWPYAWGRLLGLSPGFTGPSAGPIALSPLPGLGDGPPACGLGGHDLAVNRFSRNVGAATEFVRFVATEPDVQRLLAHRHSLAPTMASLYIDEAADEMLTTVREALPSARARPPLVDWSAVSKEIQLRLDEFRRGDAPLERTVTGIARALESSAGAG